MKARKQAAYFALPHAVMDSLNYRKLTAYGVKLLNDLGRQYNGFNNGDLCATFSLMKLKGWRSPSTLDKAKQELIHYGFTQLTKQGGRHKPSLYALTWHQIDNCKGKLDINPTTGASALWKYEREYFNAKTCQ